MNEKANHMIETIIGILQSDLEEASAEELSKMFDDVENEKPLRISFMFSTENSQIREIYEITNP
jgi:hypothetical protein